MPEVKYAKWIANASSIFRVLVDGEDLGAYAFGKTKTFQAPADSASFQLVMGDNQPWPESNALDIAGAAIDGEVAIRCEPDLRIMASYAWACAISPPDETVTSPSAQATDANGSRDALSDAIQIAVSVTYPEYLEYMPEVKYAKWISNASSMFRVHVDGQDLGVSALGKTKTFQAPADSASFQLVIGEDRPWPESNALNISGAAIDGEVAIRCEPDLRILTSHAWACAVVPDDISAKG